MAAPVATPRLPADDDEVGAPAFPRECIGWQVDGGSPLEFAAPVGNAAKPIALLGENRLNGLDFGLHLRAVDHDVINNNGWAQIHS
jgi:hypothetical protein